jgi:putative FmdB family regulatory protein
MAGVHKRWFCKAVCVPNTRQEVGVMPVYEFSCQKCNKSFEKLCSIKENLNEITCVHCSGKEVVKKMSSFATTAKGPSFDFNSAAGSSCSSCSSGSCSTCK